MAERPDEYPDHAEMVVAMLSAIHPDSELDIREVASQISVAIDRWNLAHKSLYPTALELGRRGWTAPIWSHTMATAEIVLRTTEDSIDDYFLREYTRSWRRLERRVFREISAASVLGAWARLLEECIFAYRWRRYRIVVPALFAVYEGALAQIMGQLKRKSDPKNLASAKRNDAREGLLKLAWVSVEAFTLQLFSPRPYSLPRPRLINRNWVLHGRDSMEWTRADCLRLFQALHTVTFLERADDELSAT